MAFLGIYFCEPIEESKFQQWLLGTDRTPPIGHILKELNKNKQIAVLNSYLGLKLDKECYRVYDDLSGYVHTRGQSAIGTYLRGSNFPMLNPHALSIWASFLHSVVTVITFGVIGRHPQALQGIQLFQKIGFANAPRGGILEPFEVSVIERLFEDEVLSKLKAYSDKYYSSVIKINYERLEQTPNLSLEELRNSFEQWWEILKVADHGDIPGKTWYTELVTSQTQDKSESSLDDAETPDEFVRIATYFFRQMNVGDEIVLAQGYTENLLRERSYFKSIKTRLSSKVARLVRQIHSWAKSTAYQVWWNTPTSAGTSFSFRYANEYGIFSVFTVLPNGYVIIHYDHLETAVGNELLLDFHKGLRSIPSFGFLPEHPNPKNNPTFEIDKVFVKSPDSLKSFKRVVENLGEHCITG